MRGLVTPKQVARAIGVSEASLKRWCDKGLLPVRRTAGGHRRLPLPGVIEFLRNSHYDLVEPEVLGLPATSGRTPAVLERAAGYLREPLEQGNEEQCRQLVFDLYLAGHHLCEVCDVAIAPAFYELGERWQHGKVEVYQERRACEICLRVLHELRAVLVPPAQDAPRAVGGTLAEDESSLPTTMVELVLREGGWRAETLGTGHPTSTLCAAIKDIRPRLFWLSVSYVNDPDQLVSECETIYRTAVDSGAALVVGGRALDQDIRQRIQYAAYCDHLRHLTSFAETLQPRGVSSRTSGDGVGLNHV
ncbi:MAG: MerR family DNA-binding transcriptional regulator [Phycisphaerales bacterium]|nr:MAG: MerR family DNA-binding transcriptional regulator [Phycisphaerales bacterium]